MARAQGRADEAVREADKAEAARHDAENALRAARSTVEELKRQHYVIEMRTGVARDELEERRAEQRKAVISEGRKTCTLAGSCVLTGA